MKKIFYAIMVLVYLLGTGMLFGCSTLCEKKDSSADKKTIVDSFAQIALSYDSDSAKYDAALKTAGNFLSGTISAQEASDTVNTLIDSMQEEYENVKYNELTDDFKKLLNENDVIAEEYVIYTNQRADKLSERTKSLNTLLYYIEEAKETGEKKNDLSFVYDYQVKLQAAECGYEFYSINYWFANWDEESAKLVKTEVLDKLTSFNRDNLPWKASRTEAENELTLFVDKMQECIESFERYYADRKDELDAVQRGEGKLTQME